MMVTMTVVKTQHTSIIERTKYRINICQTISGNFSFAICANQIPQDTVTLEIARTLNTSWPAVARLEDPHHWPNLKQLERAAAAVGQRLVISLEPISANMK